MKPCTDFEQFVWEDCACNDTEALRGIAYDPQGGYPGLTYSIDILAVYAAYYREIEDICEEHDFKHIPKEGDESLLGIVSRAVWFAASVVADELLRRFNPKKGAP